MSTKGKFYTDGDIAEIKGRAMNHGVEVGRTEYRESSPETKRFMETTAMEIKYIKDEVFSIKGEISEIKHSIIDEDKMRLIMKDTLEIFREQSNKLYAGKTTEKIVWTLLGSILAGVVGLFYFIVQGHIKFQ